MHCGNTFNVCFDPKTGLHIQCNECASILKIAPIPCPPAFYNETLGRHLTSGEISHYRGGGFTDGFPDAWDEPGFVLKTSASA